MTLACPRAVRRNLSKSLSEYGVNCKARGSVINPPALNEETGRESDIFTVGRYLDADLTTVHFRSSLTLYCCTACTAVTAGNKRATALNPARQRKFK